MKFFHKRATNGWSWGAAGVGVGAGTMYLFDPQGGRRRRALVRDKLHHWVRLAEEGTRRSAADLEHRTQGLFAEMRARLAEGDVPDEILSARVRSKLGHLVSHPRAIDVDVKEGRVRLTGAILESEAPRLLRRVASVPGVKGIEDRLARHESSGREPALQGAHVRSERMELLQENWTPSLRLAAGLVGAGLAYEGLRSPHVFGRLGALVGSGVLLRAMTNLPTRRLFGIGAGHRAVDVQKAIHIDAPVEEVFAYFANFENFPRFMSHLRSVEVRHGRSRWTAAGPAGISVHWDAEVTRMIPNEVLAWKSLPDSEVQNAGLVRFERDPRGGTRVEVRMSYNPPAGALGHFVAALFGTDPRHAMNDDLLRLKSLLEEGKATAHGTTVSREEVEPRREPGMDFPGGSTRH